MNLKCELYNDHMQNFKRYNIPKAQLIIADIPYNLGNNAYASSPEWYIDGDNKKGESKKANKSFFDTDHNFNLAEFWSFVHKMLKKEPKEKGQAPCMIVFCSFQQINLLTTLAKRYGFMHYIPIIFCKKTSPQVLKANMKIVGATEYALIFYRDKLPKFRNNGKMIKNWFEWEVDSRKEIKKIHPTQKPIKVLKRLIEIFTDVGDVIIDPCAGSGSTLRASKELNRHSFGFEIKKDMCKLAEEHMINYVNPQLNLFDEV